jgi:dolichyl-phosphate-mannose-protein mannosyltransferase
VSRRALLLVFVACALPRLAALAIWPIDLDTLYYQLSTGLSHAHRFAIDGEPVTRIEPFYPFVLAAGRVVTGDHAAALVVLQILIASLGGVLLFGLTRDATSDPRAAWIAALLYAVSPYLVRQSVAFMEVTVAIVLLMGAAWRIQRVTGTAHAVVLGLLLGAFVLTRFSFLPIAAGGVLVLVVRHAVRHAIVATLVAAGCVVPWMAYSRAASDAALPPRIGENLFVSTSEYAWPVIPRLNPDLLIPIADDLVRDDMARRGVTSYGPAERDRVLTQLAIDYARAHPLATLSLKIRNLLYILQPRLLPFYERFGRAAIVDGRLEIPEQRRRPAIFEIVAAAFQTILMVGGVAGLVIRRRNWRDDAFLLIVGASVIAVNVIFFPTSRLLAPMAFVWMAFASVAGRQLIYS